MKHLLGHLSIDKSSIRCIFNQSDDGIDGWQKSFKKFCNNSLIEEISLENAYLLDDLIFLSLEYDRIIVPALFCSKAQLYNVHFSLLPAYKGMYTSALPILHQQRYSGVTLHRIDQGIDTGDIIAQSKFELWPFETARSLYHKYLCTAEQLIFENITSLLSGNCLSSVQSLNGSSYYSKKSIDYKKIELDVNQVASSIDAQIRAFCFREYQYISMNTKQIVGSCFLDTKSTKKSGMIIQKSFYFCDIATIDYDIRLFYVNILDDFFEAVHNSDYDLVLKIVQLFPNIKLQTYDNGYTAAMIAAYRGDKKIYSTVFHNDIAEWCNYNGTNLLMFAKSGYVRTGNDEIFSELLRRYPGLVHKIDCKGMTVLDYMRDQHEEAAINIVNNIVMQQ